MDHKAPPSVSCWEGTPWAQLQGDCCDTVLYGTGGNPRCWDAHFTFRRCCENLAGENVAEPELLEDAIESELQALATDRYYVVQHGAAREVIFNKGHLASHLTQFRFDAKNYENDVRIFVHDVPTCAGEMLLTEFLNRSNNDTWGLFVHQQAEHLYMLHKTIMHSGAIVPNAADATVFYIPAFWSLLIEKGIEMSSLLGKDVSAIDSEGIRAKESFYRTGRVGHECISETFELLRESRFYTRNAAYDHFWVAGVQHPFNPCTMNFCQLEIFDPWFKNMMFMAAAVREHGIADKLLDWGTPLYAGLQRIFVPYSTTVDCARLQALAGSPRQRQIAISFVGSVSSRIRAWLAELANLMPLVSDSRVLLRFPGAAEVRTASRMDVGVAGIGTLNLTQIYMNTDFCLVLPGHLHDPTKRCFDAMAQGCLPVVITQPRFWISLPFVAHAQRTWDTFASFGKAGSREELMDIIRELLHRHEEKQASIRQQRSALSQAFGLFAGHDKDGCSASASSAFEGNLLQELLARQRAWPYISAAWPAEYVV